MFRVLWARAGKGNSSIAADISEILSMFLMVFSFGKAPLVFSLTVLEFPLVVR